MTASLLLLAAACLPAQDISVPDPVLLEMYDVRDLCDRPGGEADDERRHAQLEEATDLLQLFVTSLLDDRDAELKGKEGTLLVRGSADTQKDVRAILAALREDVGGGVRLDFQLLECRDAECAPSLTDAGVDLAAIGPVGHAAYTIDRDSHRELMARLQGEGKADSLTSPSLVTRCLARWSLSTLQEVAYVSGWESVELADGTVVADPRIEVLQEGVLVEGLTLGLPVESGESLVALSVRLHVLEVQRPMETREGPLGQVHVPETSADRFSFRAMVPEDSHLLLVGPPRKQEGEKRVRTVLLVRAAVIRPGDHEDGEPEDLQARIRQLLEKRRRDRDSDGGTESPSR